MIMISIFIILNIERKISIQGNCRRNTELWNMRIPRPTFLLKFEIDDVIWSGTTLSQQEEVKEFYSMIMVFGILICWFDLVSCVYFLQKKEVGFLILFSTGFTNFSCVLLVVVYWWYHNLSNGASTKFLNV